MSRKRGLSLPKLKREAKRAEQREYKRTRKAERQQLRRDPGAGGSS